MNYEKGFDRMSTAFCLVIALIVILDFEPVSSGGSFWGFLCNIPILITIIFRGDASKDILLIAVSLVVFTISVKAITWAFIKTTQWIIAGFKEVKSTQTKEGE